MKNCFSLGLSTLHIDRSKTSWGKAEFLREKKILGASTQFCPKSQPWPSLVFISDIHSTMLVHTSEPVLEVCFQPVKSGLAGWLLFQSGRGPDTCYHHQTKVLHAAIQIFIVFSGLFLVHGIP